MVSAPSSNDLTLTLDAFIRSVAVNRRSPHAFFLGAGASVSSGVPSAGMCIWEWKRQIFLTNNPRLQTLLGDVSMESVQQKIQHWLDSEGSYPALNAEEEYGFYAERCYPIADDRRRYFENLAESGLPYVGYKLLCLLAESGLIKGAWTTNFDGLVARAAASFKVTPVEVGLDSSHRAFRMPSAGELLCVSIHGDYRYDRLKNTEAELQRQDAQLRAALVDYLQDTSLIVSGYSGRDKYVMETLHSAYSRRGPARLYWCGREGEEPGEPVRRLLLTARAGGREAFYVPTLGFDDLMLRLSLHCLAGELLDRAKQLVEADSEGREEKSPAFIVSSDAVTRLIKSNAFQVECPGEMLEFNVPSLNVERAWELLRGITAGTRIAAGLLKRKVLALGTLDEIRQTFSGLIEGEITRTPISERELAITGGVVTSVLTKAVVKALAESRGLRVDEKRDVLWDEARGRAATARGTDCVVYDAAAIFLRRYAGKQYLVVKPTIHAEAKGGGELPEETIMELKRQLLTKQYNRQFNDATNAWRERLFPRGSAVVEFPPNTGSAFRFNISRSPAFAGISEGGGRPRPNLSQRDRRSIVHKGFEVREPALLFSNRQGSGLVKDTNPLRGIVENQPYDYVLTREGFQDTVRVGVICPTRDSQRLANYLNGLQHKRAPDSKFEYLLEYPGFAQAFGLPLDLPRPQGNAWQACPEVDPSLDEKSGSVALVQNLKACITSLKSAASPHVIVIFVPERWRRWEYYNNEGERFDLHDFIKAYCVQHGIATQFLRENTFNKPHQCEVMWWLALSLYAKAMRTPWILEEIDHETAFMGLGYSLDLNAPRGKHVVLGCSHIYNSEGVGLRYRLSKIEEPVWRQKNPHMSREDARRAGDGVRQLFYESMMKLPRRVVIHKMTPFLPSEREGLLEGLAGIEQVDMLEINIDPALRYVSSSWRNNGFQTDSFPVNRGTAVVLDSRRALVWAHGTVQATMAGRHYYLGKSRIPAPLIVIRHYGRSSLSVLARELLGLSKMNWNTFDMYTKLPATVQSSGEIARVGALLDRFKPGSYDYRLFI